MLQFTFVKPLPYSPFSLLRPHRMTQHVQPAFSSLPPDSSIRPLKDQPICISLQYRRDWFFHNGDSPHSRDHEKSTFFDVALNHVLLNIDEGKGVPIIVDERAIAAAIAIIAALVAQAQIPEKRSLVREELNYRAQISKQVI